MDPADGHSHRLALTLDGLALTLGLQFPKLNVLVYPARIQTHRSVDCCLCSASDT